MPNCACQQARTSRRSFRQGVVVAELPPVDSAHGQRNGGPVLSSARAATGKRFMLEDAEPSASGPRSTSATPAASPNALGVRASVPGNGSDERIWARYTAQWWSSAAQEWKTVGGSGVTDWVHVGTADMSARQAGWTFRFVQPPSGHHLRDARRGRVRMARRGPLGAQGTQGPQGPQGSQGHRAQRVAVVRQRTLLTETGMQGVQGGDPAGTSKAMCLIW